MNNDVWGEEVKINNKFFISLLACGVRRNGDVGCGAVLVRLQWGLWNGKSESPHSDRVSQIGSSSDVFVLLLCLWWAALVTKESHILFKGYAEYNFHVICDSPLFYKFIQPNKDSGERHRLRMSRMTFRGEMRTSPQRLQIRHT